MNKKIKKAWGWVKDHKIGIACTVAMTVGGVYLFKTNKDSTKLIDMIKFDKPMPNPDKFIPDISIGTVADYAKYAEGTVTELWMDNIPLDELGDLSVEIRSKVPGIPENAIVWTILNIRPGEVNEV